MAQRRREHPGHAQFVPYLLNRVTARLNAPFQQVLNQRQMTLTHWRVLAFLAEHDGLPVTLLADRTATDQSTLSRALMRMDSEGLVARRAHASDHRVIEVHLTPKGRALFDALLPEALAQHKHAVRGIPAAEVQALTATLSRILANLE